MNTDKFKQRATIYMVATFFLFVVLMGGAFFMFHWGYHGTAWLWFGLAAFNAVLFWFNKRMYDQYK